jgi:hypothetical protein
MSWTVRFFVTSDGSAPQREFIEALPTTLRAALLGKIAATAEVSGKIGGHIFHPLHTVSGLFEIRAKSGVDLARSLCCRDGQNLILLNGVRKRIEEPTPEADVSRAVELRRQYLETKRTEPPY